MSRMNETIHYLDYREERGAYAYRAYAKATGGVSLITGRELPEWKELPEEIRACWIASADAVVARYSAF